MSVTSLFSTRPSAPADRAEQAVPLALELVDAVRCWRPSDVESVLDRADKDALLVVLAAMVDDTRTVGDVLGWLTGQPEPTTPRGPYARRVLKPCGTHAAYNRHVDRGEPVDPLCEQAERRYQRLRMRDRRAAARDDAARSCA